MLGTNN